MAVTLSTFGHFIAGTTPVALETNNTLVTSQGAATTLVLPVSPTTDQFGPSYTIPLGSTFTVYNGGTGALTPTAGGSDTYAGTASVAAAAKITFVRTGATTWTGF